MFKARPPGFKVALSNGEAKAKGCMLSRVGEGRKRVIWDHGSDPSSPHALSLGVHEIIPCVELCHSGRDYFCRADHERD